MDGDEQFWIAVWKIVASGVCVIAAIAGGCTANTHLAVSRDLQKGVDPVAVSCAHDMTEAAATCLILASRR